MIRYRAHEMNCLQCCIAGILNLPLDLVPTFLSEKDREEGRIWVDDFEDWCMLHDFFPTYIKERDEAPCCPHIAVGYNNGGTPHCVIMQNDEVLWNPDERGELDSIRYRIKIDKLL